MVWGGSLNEKGSDYVRKLVEIEKTIKFLEQIKNELNSDEKEYVDKTIDIIVNHFSKRSRDKT
jgi:hypothetical protein